MSMDEMSCGCLGHADLEHLCRYPAMKARAEQAELRIYNLTTSVEASQARVLRLEKDLDEWEQAWGLRGSERLKLTARLERLETVADGERLAREAAQQHRCEAESRLGEATTRNLGLIARAEQAERERDEWKTEAELKQAALAGVSRALDEAVADRQQAERERDAARAYEAAEKRWREAIQSERDTLSERLRQIEAAILPTALETPDPADADGLRAKLSLWRAGAREANSRARKLLEECSAARAARERAEAERDEAVAKYAEVARENATGLAAFIERGEALKRAEADNAALLTALQWAESELPDALCQRYGIRAVLRSPHPGAAMLEYQRALERVREAAERQAMHTCPKTEPCEVCADFGDALAAADALKGES